MFGFWGGSRRPKSKTTQRSFKPWIDALEVRLTPSSQPTLLGPPVPVDPPIVLPPVNIGQNSVVTVSTQTLQVTAGGDPATFTLVLNTQPTAEVDVTLAAYAPLPYAAVGANTGVAAFSVPITIAQPHLVFTTQDWNTPQTVSVSAPASTADGTCASIYGTTTSADSNFDAQAVPPISVSVSNPTTNPTGGITVSTQELQLQAGGPSGTYTIALTSQPTADVTVTIDQANPVLDPPGPVPIGGGTPGGVKPADANGNPGPLTVTPQTLTFTADDWNVPQTVTVAAPAAGQATYYGPIVFLNETVTSSDPNYNGILGPSVRVDVATPGVTLSTHVLYVTRGGNGDSVNIALATQPTDTVTVTIAQSGGDALSINPSTLTFTPDDWNTAQTVTVGPPTSGTGKEIDTLTLTDSSNDPNYNNGTLPTLSVFVTGPVATGQLVITPQTLDITAGGPSASYTIGLATQPTADVTITINDLGGLPQPLLGADGPITTGGGLTITPQTFTITAANWQQTQTITVAAPAGWNGLVPLDTLTATVSSDDPNYDGIAAPVVTVKITPNAAGVVLSTDHLDLTRGGPNATYTVVLASQPTADVTVTIAQTSPVMGIGLVGGTGAGPQADDPLQISPASITFTTDNWNQPATVTVGPPTSGSGDQFDILTTTVTSDDANYNNLPAPSVAVHLAANPAYQLVYSTNHLELAPGATGSYTIALASQPTDTVTVAISQGTGVPGSFPLGAAFSLGGWPSFGDSALTITPTPLTFTPDDWQTPQTVSVTAAASTDGSTVFAVDQIVHTVTSNDPNWNNIATDPVVVFVSNFKPPILVGDPVPITLPPVAGTPPITVTTPVIPTQIALSIGSSSAPVGQPITLTAKVTAGGGGKTTPTGTVLFEDGATVLGTGTLKNGVATLKTTNLNAGKHALTAVFTSDRGNQSASTSATKTTTISQVKTRTTLTSSDAPAAVGETITLTATVRFAGSGTTTPSGTVTFKDGATVLGTGTLNGGVATLQTLTLSVGTHHLTAVYAGDTNTAGSTGTLSETVKKATTATALTAAPSTAPIAFGTPITLTATVSVTSPGTVVLAGTVAFKEGDKLLGTGTLSGGVATLQTSKLAKGKHHITAVYAGDGSSAKSKSVVLTVTID